MIGPRMRKRLQGIVVIGVPVALVVVGTAGAVRVATENLVVDFNLNSAPAKLPRTHDAPIDIWGSSTIGTKDGSPPPVMKHLMLEFDKYGHVETRGLPKCTVKKLAATTTPVARKLCPGAVVGTGSGSAIVNFPDQAPIPAHSPLTFFNGPRIGGDPSIIVHAHLTVPAPTTYLVPIRIERIHKGVYGFRTESTIPAIAGGHGAVTGFRFRIDRRWRFKGEEMSYVYARCAIGRLQARLEAKFLDGTTMKGTFIDPCQVRETSAAAGLGTTRDEYVDTVEPICLRNTEANARILKGVKTEVKSGKLPKAAKRFARTAGALKKTIAQIEAVPQPVEDQAQLNSWIGFLHGEADLLRRIGKALGDDDKYKAQTLAVRLNRNAARANNTVLEFGFDHCRIDPSRFV